MKHGGDVRKGADFMTRLSGDQFQSLGKGFVVDVLLGVTDGNQDIRQTVFRRR